jgi:multidrug efflux system outer membrane protein
MKHVRIFIYIVFAFVIIRCVPVQNIPQTLDKTIPDSYSANSDTANLATAHWREYFSDPLLIGLIDTALMANYDAQVALQRIEMAKAGVQFSKGALLPTVDAGARSAVWRYGLYTQEGSGNSTTPIYEGKIIPTNLPDFLVGFQSAWEADINGKLRNRKKAAIARYLSSMEGRNWLVTNLVAEVATSYYDLLALDRELEIVRENIALQEYALSIVTIQKQAGAANELAVKQFQAQVLNTKSIELEIIQQITEAESQINFLLGRYPQRINRSQNALVQELPRQVQAGVPSDLLHNRPDIRQAEMELMAAKADVKAARAAFYPSLNITGSVGFQAFKTKLLFTTPESFAFTLVGGLSAPLLNRSAIKAEFKGATAYQIERLYDYQKSILIGYVEVYNELNNINNLQQQIILKNDEANVLTQSIQISTDLFRSGRADYLEVLFAQQKALQARLELTRGQNYLRTSTVNMYKALGGGWR